MRSIFSISFFLMCSGLLSAQVTPDSSIVEDVEVKRVQTETPRKPWYLTLGFQLKVKSLSGYIKDHYVGEYARGYNSNFTWIDTSEENKKLLTGRFYSPKIDIMVSRNRNFKFGMSYNLGVIEYTEYVNDPNFGQYEYTDFYAYLAISALGEYAYYFLKDRKSGPFVNANLALGYYRGDRFLEGPGNEYFGQVRLGGGYHTEKDLLLHVWVAHDRLYYRERSESPIFKREQRVDTRIWLNYIGIGISKQFELIPD